MSGVALRLARVAWWPLPLIAAGIVALRLIDLPGSYPSPRLQFGLQLVFMTTASAIVAFVAARSFVMRGTPGLLLMGCGVIALGLAGALATAVGTGNPNRTVSIHNLLMALGAWLHFAGVAVGSRKPVAARTEWLVTGYLATGATIVVVAIAVVGDATPTFFVQGQGGTPLRQVVLGSAVMAFVVAGALLLRRSQPEEAAAFRRWYGCGLLLVALGLLGVWLQTATNSALGWTGIATQMLGSVYIAVAALQAARDSNAWQVPLSAAPQAPALRYGLPVLFVGAAVLLRMLFFGSIGNASPYVLLYPAVLLAALYGGWGPALLAIAMSLLAAEWFWFDPLQRLILTDPSVWLIRGVFTLNSTLIAGLVLLLNRARSQTQAAEYQRRLAEQQARAAEAERAAQARTFETESRYHTLFNSIDHGGCICELVLDADGSPVDFRFLETNIAFATMTGLHNAEGKTALEMVPGLERHWVDTYARVVRTGETVRFEDRSDVMGRHFEVFAAPILHKGCFVLLIADITERQRAEEKMRRAAHRDAFGVKLGAALRPLADAIAVQATACQVLADWLNVQRVVYFEVRDGNYIVTHQHVRDVMRLEDVYPIGSFGAQIQASYEAGCTVFNAHVQRDNALSAAEKASYAVLQIAAFVGVPLTKGGRLVAGLAVHSARPREFEPDEIEAIEDTAEATWASVERARSEAALRDADRRKDEFIATLAHELRNPLAPVSNAMHVLTMTHGELPKVRRAAEVVNRQLRQITVMIDDLMDLSRVSRGLVELRLETLDLTQVVHEAVETSEPLFENLRHVLDVRLPQQPIVLKADRIRLLQVLLNLLQNAAKYTPPGGLMVLQATRDEENVFIAVRDNGVGIAAPMLERVFDMFMQSEHTTTQSPGGLGIGLALVRRLVELHSGSVRARSDGSGKGSEFTVRLPLAGPPTPPPTPKQTPKSPEASSVAAAAAPCRRILVVDDNRDAADTLGELLSLGGHEVRIAYDGEQAVQVARDYKPDVVLMDLGLPKLDGFEAAAVMRQEAWAHNTVLIATTGAGRADDAHKAVAAGFDQHMLKPIDPQLLLRVLYAARRAEDAEPA
jgi:PAS domain S-box-containing protein